jgi:hypothetical protein
MITVARNAYGFQYISARSGSARPIARPATKMYGDVSMLTIGKLDE